MPAMQVPTPWRKALELDTLQHNRGVKDLGVGPTSTLN